MTDTNDEVIELKLPPGTIIKINGIPLQVAMTATVLTARGNCALMPCEVINHTRNVEAQKEAQKSNSKGDPLHKGLIFMVLMGLLIGIWMIVIQLQK